MSVLSRLDSKIRVNEAVYFRNRRFTSSSKSYFLVRSQLQLISISGMKGIKLGDVTIPRDARLGVPMPEFHNDQDFYHDLSSFDAFRISRPYEMARQTRVGR